MVEWDRQNIWWKWRKAWGLNRILVVSMGLKYKFIYILLVLVQQNSMIKANSVAGGLFHREATSLTNYSGMVSTFC